MMKNEQGLRIISLNTWTGEMLSELTHFIEREREQTDIFCFQEIYSSPSLSQNGIAHNARIYQILTELLPNHDGFFHGAQSGFFKGQKNVDWDIDFGVAMFIKKNIQFEPPEDIFVYGHRDMHARTAKPDSFPRNLQIAKVWCGQQPLIIGNLHGYHKANTWKKDTPERLRQSKLSVQALQKGLPVIFCGDFNLRPDSQSIRIIVEGLGVKNLIDEFSITDTRTTAYKRRNVPGNTLNADYAFISPNITLESFSAMSDVVSDHKALELEISI